LAATSHGLGTCIMEGFDARRLKELLRVPDRYAACACVATGYEHQDNDNEWDSKPSPRLPLEEVVFGDTFGQAWDFDDNAEEDEEDDNGVKTA
jgi:nitroreductase